MNTFQSQLSTDYTLLLIEEDNRYVVISGENFFTVNKLVYHILYDLKENKCLPEIAVRLANLFPNVDITTESITNILGSKEISKILNPTKSKTQSIINNSYIWFKLDILHPQKISSLLKLLNPLFSGKLYKWLFMITGVITLILFIKLVLIERNFSYFNGSLLSAFDIALVFIVSQFIILIHEIGHAAAGYKNNVTSKSIGFGLYFIFPVFFTELTEIWRLAKSKRIQVNMAGIYFQLLINILLIATFYATNKPTLILVLFVMNTVSVLISFNPFFRYDGYWILSDLLSIPNLRAQSNTCISFLLKRLLKNQSPKPNETPDYSLVVYSILNLAFWVWIYLGLIIYFIATIQELLTEVKTSAIDFIIISKAIGLLIIIIFTLKNILKKETWTKYNM